MKGLNAKFKADPIKFLETSGYSCPGVITNSNVGQFHSIKGAAVKEFDLVPGGKGTRFANLTVLGGVGTYASTSRKGSPIAAHFLHWNGQTYKHGPSTFGSLNLSDCTADYIFTAPFTGCRFVVTRGSGGLKVYHEPTEDSACAYDGEIVLQLGPDYTSTGTSGNGVIVRKPGGGWKAIVSEMAFGATKATVKTADF
jgi:hypothetical protein